MQTPFTPHALRPVSDLIRQARQGVLRRRVDGVAKVVGLSDRKLEEVMKSGGSEFQNQVAWARQYLVWEG